MNPNKQYIDGFYVREKDGRYGTFLSVGIDIEKLVAQARELGDGKMLNVTLNRRKQPSDKGLTHYVTLDTYRKENAGRQFDNARRATDKAAKPPPDSQPDLPPNDGDDVPF